SPRVTLPFQFGFFSPQTGRFISLLDAPDLAEVQIDRATGTLLVSFKTTAIFTGTVFTVSLPQAKSTTTTGTIQPAATTPPGNGNQDQTRNVSFPTPGQLPLTLTASRDSRQLASSRLAEGSETRRPPPEKSVVDTSPIAAGIIPPVPNSGGAEV